MLANAPVSVTENQHIINRNRLYADSSADFIKNAWPLSLRVFMGEMLFLFYPYIGIPEYKKI